MSRPWLVLIVTALLCGCGAGTQLRRADIRPLAHYSLARVEGLRGALERSRGPVRVLVVHGMRTHEPGYSEVLQQGLARELGLVPDGRPGPDSAEIVRGYDIAVQSGQQPFGGEVRIPPSRIRRYRWVDARDPGQERLVFYEVLWAPLRDNVKNYFLACFETGTGSTPAHNCPGYDGAKSNPDRPAPLNRALKKDLMVGGFGDATIVLGPFGDVLRDDVTLAACILAQDVLLDEAQAFRRGAPAQRCDMTDSIAPANLAPAALTLQQSEFFTITMSLGSFLVMDAQRLFAQQRADPAKRAEAERENLAFHLFDDATVFMLANQVSLLHLGRLDAICQPAGGGSECPNPALPTTDDWFNAEDPLSQMTTYVAFNDTDDLLGFELPWYLTREGLFGPMVNVAVRNPAPRYLGLFEHPGTHVRHELNPAVIRAIAHGFDVPRLAPAASAQPPAAP